MNKDLTEQLTENFEFSNEHELRETVSAVKFYDKDISEGIKPIDAYNRIKGSYGVIFAENVKDFNKLRLMNKKDLELLKKCDGKHSTLNELFDCESCAVLFNKPEVGATDNGGCNDETHAQPCTEAIHAY